MKRSIGACAILLCTALPALGDGLPGPSLKDAQVSTRSINCYVGAFASGSFIHDADTILAVSSLTSGVAAFGGGPQIGCDTSTSLLLVGLWADYTFNTGSLNSSMPTMAMNIPVTDEWAVGGRLGLYTSAAHTTLIYGLLGYGGASSSTLTATTPLATLAAHFQGANGAVAGGGIEAALTSNITGFLEYRHNFFNTNNSMLFVAVAVTPVVPIGSNIAEDRVLAGLRYHF